MKVESITLKLEGLLKIAPPKKVAVLLMKVEPIILKPTVFRIAPPPAPPGLRIELTAELLMKVEPIILELAPELSIAPPPE
ncbi:hypothetical protein MBCUT_08800 [Methanobrevibacter cuticularis]|uniref:Uncharacterized protein n=1 Tax=Methanobrevibacter cuticularis TaxID=47311 RepID=A0A166E8F7_9EURY|nr:hypothetical protein MBCUT_08800 [Methanobrevibacter cuticularis]